jgi:hypothetical protein
MEVFMGLVLRAHKQFGEIILYLKKGDELST